MRQVKRIEARRLAAADGAASEVTAVRGGAVCSKGNAWVRARGNRSRPAVQVEARMPSPKEMEQRLQQVTEQPLKSLMDSRREHSSASW